MNVMTGKTTILAAVTLILLAAVGMTVVLAQRADEPPPDLDVVDLSQIKEEAIRNLYDSSGKRIDPNMRAAKIARDHEGGFGGYYLDKTDKSIVYVYMLDVTKTAAAEAAFRAAYYGDREISQIIPVQGDYSLDQLVEWYSILIPAFVASEIRLGIWHVYELENRIYIGLRDKDQIDDALLIMEGLGIPAGAAILVEDYIKKANKDSVTAKWRPLVGGIQHEEAFWGEPTRTIGFVTEREALGIEGNLLMLFPVVGEPDSKL